MDQIELPGWRIEYDRSATVAMLARMPTSGPDSCHCAPCKNWAATRRNILPVEFQALLEELGIPLDREIEIIHFGRLESGQHFYGGWYHFVGHVLEGEQELAPHLRVDSFAWFFHAKPALLTDASAGLPIVQLEIEAEIPWLSNLPEAS
ncbi:hypothetical protein [Roseimaritima ulvae]|nr:hypothetical protein [Roseimaritima ulvae]